MALLSNVRRIVAEDYPKDDQETITRLGSTLNNFMEEVVNVINGNIGYDNLLKTVSSIEIQTNTQGKFDNLRLRVELSYIRGISILNITNLNNSQDELTQAPFPNFTYLGNGEVHIRSITGLKPNTKYLITMEFTP